MPKHYEFVGVIERFIEDLGVVGVELTEAKIRRGDRIAFELPVEFQEQDVESLQIENQGVEEAEVGSLAGLRTELTKEQAKRGARVFRLV